MKPINSPSDSPQEPTIAPAAPSSLLARLGNALRFYVHDVVKSPMLPKTSNISTKDAERIATGIESVDESTLTPEALSVTEKALLGLEQINQAQNQDLSDAERDANALLLLAHLKTLTAPSNPIRTAPTIRNDQEKIGRNDPCTCGCGQKFKNCPKRKR